MPGPKKVLVHTAARGPCAVCGREGLPCGACRVDYYCDKPHQRADWRRHRRGCGVLAVSADHHRLRLVAVKDIPAGTVVMREDPILVLAPLVPGGIDPETHALSMVYCAGCCRRLQTAAASQCPRCGAPVCGAACGQDDRHRLECAALERAKFKLPSGEVPKLSASWVVGMQALRFHLASQMPAVGPRLLALRSVLPPLASVAVGSGPYAPHMVSARTADEKENYERIEAFLKKTGLKGMDVDALHHALVAVQLNKIDMSDCPDYGTAALFSGLSLAEHSCLPSCRLYAECEGAAGRRAVSLVTTRPVARGEALSRDCRQRVDWCGCSGLPVEDPLDGRVKRRMELVYWRGLLCRCHLCAHPDEFGLRLSDWCCEACAGRGQRSLVTVEDLPPPAPGSEGLLAVAMAGDKGRWRCGGCGKEGQFPLEYTTKLDDELDDILEARCGALDKLEAFVDAHLWPRGRLHDTHHLILKAKCAMAMLPGHVDEDSLESLSRREAHCRAALRAVEVLRPGATAHRWRLLLALFEILRWKIKAEVVAARKRDRTVAEQAEDVQPYVRECLDLVNIIEKISLSPIERNVFQIRVKEQSETLLSF